MVAARRVLVILRTGDQSLHPEWFTNARPESRNWDFHISYFGDLRRPFRNRYPDVTLSFEKGTKSEGTALCLEKLGNRVDEYDWIWLPDDDLLADLATLNRFFEIVAEYDLDLAQPALGAGSFIAYRITAQRPHMRLRFTTFVEIMAPCFSRRALRLCAPYLNATVSSWGISWMFPKLLDYSKRGIAIVDETPVIHTRRPGRGPNTALTIAAGLRPQQELDEFLSAHQLKKRLETWGGIDLAGNFVSDKTEIDSQIAMVR